MARDADGNEVSSAPVTIDVVDGSVSDYSEAVLADGPILYYPLGDTTDPLVGEESLLTGSGVGRDTDGIASSDTGSSSLNGGSWAYLSPRGAAAAAPEEFTTEVWMRSDSRDGGRISGFSNRQTWSSSRHDRVVYMSDEGRLVFGVYPSGPDVITSEESFNDGEWHHVVASQGADGMTLTVDGEVVASDPDVTEASDHTGYWRFGGDYLGWRWPDRPSDTSLDGELDKAAVYDRVLTPAEIASHHEIGRG